MRWIRSRDRRTAQRLAAVDGYRFPAGVRHRFAVAHYDLDIAALALVEDAARQWFRLAARHPRADLSMPSVLVDDLWREMLRDPRGYAEFCEAAFRRPFPRPESGAEGPAGLATTFRLAREDESCPPPALPLLFRIDRELGVLGGGHYLADCGGRADCHELPGAVCLTHVAGLGAERPWRGRLRSMFQPPDVGTGGGAIGA